MPSFSDKKALKFVVSLATNKFGSSNNNTITLYGFRSLVEIDKAGGMMMGVLKARIYGVKQSDMNSITTLQWKAGTFSGNTVEVYAISGDSETLIFSGNIVNAWGDYQSVPDVYLNITAQSAFFASIAKAEPRSFKGSVSVPAIMAQIAKDMGMSFENNGVDNVLNDVYLSNTGLEQARELAQMADIDIYIDNNTIAITPKYAKRGTIIPMISPQSGLIGYPTFDAMGVTFQMLFNPAVQFGGAVSLDTSLPHAKGQWIVTSLSYNLEAEKPDGKWIQTVRGTKSGLAIVK